MEIQTFCSVVNETSFLSRDTCRWNMTSIKNLANIFYKHKKDFCFLHWNGFNVHLLIIQFKNIFFNLFCLHFKSCPLRAISISYKDAWVVIPVRLLLEKILFYFTFFISKSSLKVKDKSVLNIRHLAKSYVECRITLLLC